MTRPPSIERGALTPDSLRIIGESLYGKHWQSEIATRIACSKSQVTRYLNQSRGMSSVVASHLQHVIVSKLVDMVDLMDKTGMPHAGSAEVAELRVQVARITGAIPGKAPAMDAGR